MSSSQENIRKILVVTLSNLGDVILTLPVFQSLIEKFPKAEIHVVAGPAAQAVWEGDGRIKKVTAFNKKISWAGKLAFLKGIRDERYDLIVDLRRSLIGLLGGARFRNSYFIFPKKRMHQSLRHLCALENIAPPAAGLESFLRVDGQAAARVDEWLGEGGGKRLVAAAVGSKSDIKKWPAEHYAKLLDRLAGDDCRVVLVGDKNDAADAAKVKRLMTADVLDLSGQTTFRELAAILKRVSLLVTNDSAPLHIADALKTPVLAIFGPTDPRKYGPRSAQSTAVRRVLFCAPCERAQCRYRHECMKELGVDEVYQKAAAILNDEDRRKKLKILVIRLDRIGDLVLSLPAIEAIRSRFPDAFISVMTRSYTREMVEGHPLIDEVIPYRYEKDGRHASLLGYFRFLREIIERRFDIAFILHPSVRSHLLPFLAGVPYRIGFDSCAPFLLTKKAPDRRHEGRKHESEYTLDIVRAFGIEPPKEKRLFLPVFTEDHRTIEKILEAAGFSKEDGIIALHPGASCPSKRWPLERYVLLGKKALENTPYRLAVIGGKEEIPLGQSLKEALGERALDLTGKLGLKELAAFLKRCEFLVTNDSGPVHVAAAVGTRTLCIFGRNQAGLSVSRWKVLGKGHETIQKDVGCAVCLAHRCTIGFECLKAVEVDEVFERLAKMISMEAASCVVQK